MSTLGARRTERATTETTCDALSQAIAGAKVVLMPAESTMINLDQPEAFNRIVLDFLDAIKKTKAEEA